MADATPCAVPTCPGLAVAEFRLCAVHLGYTRRLKGEAPIHCYACGRLIRIGARWVARREGAFCARVACQLKPAADYVTPIFEDATRANEAALQRLQLAHGAGV